MMTMQALFVAEFVIYIRIVYKLWGNDQRMKDKISKDDFLQRKRKNVITLSGQCFSFFIEFLTSLFMIIQIAINDLGDTSVMPIVIITSSCIISMSQLWTSHESRRFIKSKLIDWNILHETSFFTNSLCTTDTKNK